MQRKNIVVLTGAGVSAESGIKTFRDADGLWEGHDVMKVASPQGWDDDPDLVLDFYNQRRRQLSSVEPNAAHHAIKQLETSHNVWVVTQNVDNLHERAHSSQIIHLHGELAKSRSVLNSTQVFDCEGDMFLGDIGPDGGQLRPHIVWFGEMVPMLDTAITLCESADLCIIVGTSMQVYPAASLVGYLPAYCDIYYIDPKPQISYELSRARNLVVIEKNATIGVPELVRQLSNE